MVKVQFTDRAETPGNPARGQPMMRCLAVCWALLAAGLCLFSAWAHLKIGLNSDTGLLAHEAQLLLHGAAPYLDYADVDPPLSHLLFVPPVLAAALSGLPAALAVNAMALLLAAISLALSGVILRRGDSTRISIGIILSGLALALLAASCIHQVFADREYLLMALISPWLVLCSPVARRDSTPPRWRMLAALLAGMGFALKPYAYVFYAAALCCRLRDKPLSRLMREPEQWAIIGIGMLYLAAVLVFFPRYPFDILPVAWQTYRALSWPWDAKMGVIQNDLLGGYGATGLALALILWLMAPALCRGGIGYLLILLLAAIGCYALSGGWYYTQYPFIAVALMLAVASGSRLMQACMRLPLKRQRISALIATGGALIAGLFHYFAAPAMERAQWDIWSQAEHGYPLATVGMDVTARARIEAQLLIHPCYLLLATGVWSEQLLNADPTRQSVGRFDYLWPLPGIAQLQNDPARQEDYRRLAHYLAQAIAEDIRRHAPQLVIVDTSPLQQSLPEHYRILGLLRQDAEFARQWRAYRLAETVDACTNDLQSNCAYALYMRD